MMEFFVAGTPAPGGSKTVFPIWKRDGTLVTTIKGGRVWPVFRVVDDAGKRNKAWRGLVESAAAKFMSGAPPFERALKVEMIFFIQRPQCHFRTGKFSHLLRDDAPQHHTQVPDALKFARSTEDAMTGFVWKDDASTVRVCAEKKWCAPGEVPGCAIRIVPL